MRVILGVVALVLFIGVALVGFAFLPENIQTTLLPPEKRPTPTEYVALGDSYTAAPELAKQIAAASPYTIGLGKKGFYDQIGLDVEQAYALTEKIMVENAQAPDAIEGMQAFLERRPPKWGK